MDVSGSSTDPQSPSARLTPSALAAARRTMGVSSVARSLNKPLISVWDSWSTKGYAVANKAQAEVREVNQSPRASRRRRGRKADCR